MKKILTYLTIAFVATLSSCNGGNNKKAKEIPEKPTNEEITNIYGLYVKGDFEKYVGNINSCHGKPTEYKRQMVVAMKQHLHEQEKETGGIKSFSVARIEPNAKGRQANVFINLNYANGSSEEILLSMVYAGGKWEMQ